jgi:hypothetical protein
MTDRGFRELESDANKEARSLLGCVEGGDWMGAGRRLDQLAEMVARLHHEASTRASLERVRAINQPTSEREAR